MYFPISDLLEGEETAFNCFFLGFPPVAITKQYFWPPLEFWLLKFHWMKEMTYEAPVLCVNLYI